MDPQHADQTTRRGAAVWFEFDGWIACDWWGPSEQSLEEAVRDGDSQEFMTAANQHVPELAAQLLRAGLRSPGA